jgi:hypothetical protein
MWKIKPDHQQCACFDYFQKARLSRDGLDEWIAVRLITG